ncbi:MAG: hypothetical protein H6572_11790 [Lewinellaceae bacterium]|nr:hypothetical protein [Lewinellaceae bacterium]
MLTKEPISSADEILNHEVIGHGNGCHNKNIDFSNRFFEPDEYVLRDLSRAMESFTIVGKTVPEFTNDSKNWDT